MATIEVKRVAVRIVQGYYRGTSVTPHSKRESWADGGSVPSERIRQQVRDGPSYEIEHYVPALVFGITSYVVTVPVMLPGFAGA